MDLRTIKYFTEKKKGGFRELALAIGMTDTNLHRCVRENKIQAADLEKIARHLGVGISEFFDEDVRLSTRLSGRDYYERGDNRTQISDSAGEGWRQLAEERKERIEELKEKIKELEEELGQ